MLLTRPLRLVILIVLGLLLLAPSAAAGGGDAVERRGDCDSGPGEWKLIVRRETSTTLRVRFRIKDVRPGQLWDVFLSDNGTRFFTKTERADSSGEVQVTAYPWNRSGSDHIAAFGYNRANGVSCQGSLIY